MIKKDYEKIAQAISTARSDRCCDTVRTMVIEIVHQISMVMKEDDPNFDMYEFAEACLPNETKPKS